MTEATVEAEARRYLRLFPEWMREVRGEEAVGLVLDQLPAGTQRLPVRARLDLLRSGLHARRRGTPPPRVWNRLAYTTIWRNDPVVPAQWRAWLASVIMTRWITVVYALLRTSPFLVYPVMQLILPTSGDRFLALYFLLLWLGIAVGLFVVRGERWRSRVLLVNGFGPDGRPLPPDQIGQSWSQQAMPNTWSVPALAGFVVVGGIYGPVSWFQADQPDAPSLVLSAALVGLVAAVFGRVLRRLGQVDASPPAWMLPNDDRTRNVLSAACGAGAGLIWAWSAGLAAMLVGGSLLVAVSAPLGALCAVVLVRRTERRIGRRVGEWDLHPAWAPQLVERPVTHLPSPPGGPSTPALG